MTRELPCGGGGPLRNHQERQEANAQDGEQHAERSAQRRQQHALGQELPHDAKPSRTKTQAQRLASGDPRLSLEERYGTQAGYVAAVTAAANDLVARRFMIDYPFEEMPGYSVFYKDEAGDIFHTYSTFARGTELVGGVYGFLDVTPKGRNEPPGGNLTAWVRRHDEYGEKAGDSGCHG